MLVLVSSALAIVVTYPEADIASWWPAVGVGAIAVLLSRRRWWLTVLGVSLASGIGIALAGRPLALSAVVAIGIGVEMLMFCAAVTRLGRRAPTLSSVADVLVMIGASLVSAVPLAVTVAVAQSVTAHNPPWVALATVIPSHAAAMLTIVPIVIFTGDRRALGLVWERVAQPVVLVVVLAFVFIPGDAAPLHYTVLPVLVWAAIRLSARVAALELFFTALVTTVLTNAGGGPFANIVNPDPRVSTVLVLGYLLIQASVLLLVIIAENGRDTLTKQAIASHERMRTALDTAHVGLLLIEHRSGGLRVLEANAAARNLGLVAFDASEGGKGTPSVTELRVLVADVLGRRTPDSHPVAVTLADSGYELDVYVSDVPDADGRVLHNFQIVDVTAQRRTERSLLSTLDLERSSVDRLEAINTKHEDFVALVSHELRTPLTSIRGYGEELADEELGAQARAYVEIINRNAERLTELVGQLLATGLRSETGSSRARSVWGLAQDIVQDAGAEARTRGVSLALVGSAPSADTRHHDAYEKILANLVANALKYAPAGAHVRVAIIADDATVTLTVTDDGPGIPPELLESVFERFFRVDHYSAIVGTGLGLPIVRRIVEQLGGTIVLDSDGHSGTTATVELPREQIVA